MHHVSITVCHTSEKFTLRRKDGSLEERHLSLQGQSQGRGLWRRTGLPPSPPPLLPVSRQGGLQRGQRGSWKIQVDLSLSGLLDLSTSLWGILRFLRVPLGPSHCISFSGQGLSPHWLCQTSLPFYKAQAPSPSALGVLSWKPASGEELPGCLLRSSMGPQLSVCPEPLSSTGVLRGEEQ